MIEGRRVVLGVCGGVAAYKAVELCRRLVDLGAFVSPVLTESATRFIGAATFAAVASEPPRLTLWDSPEPSPHTHLGKSADLIVVAPATARLIGSYAHGLSEDLLSTTLLATNAPVVLGARNAHRDVGAPWRSREHLDPAITRVIIVEPESGSLAGGDTGVGRLADTPVLLDAVIGVLGARDDVLRGKTVLVTAGGTREAIDPVRFIGNRSSGKQGYAIASEAVARGANVVLVTSSSLQPPTGVKVVTVETAEEMHRSVMAHLSEADAVVMAAAVADFRPADPKSSKIKKADGAPLIRLEPTVDVLSAISEKRHDGQVIVGFAAETHDAEANGRAKLESKRLDIIVVNDVTESGAGFGTSTNRVLILDKNGRNYRTGLVEKRTVAAELLDHVSELINATS